MQWYPNSDHYNDSEPANPSLTLMRWGLRRAAAPQILTTCFQLAIFGHEKWPLAKVPEIAHILSFYPTGSKFSLFSSTGSGLWDMDRFSKLPYLGIQLKVPEVTHIVPKLHWVPNFTPFCSTIARFPENWGFRFLYRVQWWIWKFRTNIVKNRKLKIPKIPNVALWGRTIGRKIQDKFVNVWLWFVGGVAFWNLYSHWVPC